MSDSYKQLSSFIWNVCDDVLRGLFKPHEYGDIILPFTVLRRLDCVLEPYKDEIYKVYEEYRDKVDDPTAIALSKIKTSHHIKLSFLNRSKFDLKRLKSDPQNIHINFQNYLDGYSDNVAEILENFQLEKPVQKLNKNNRLFLLIDKFTEIDLHPDEISNREMGIIFEDLLRRFSEMSNETSGEHYTPRDVVRLVVALVFAENAKDLTGEGKVRSIFDPCCGSGGMLTIGKKYIKQNVNKSIELRLLGQEINPQTYSICRSEMLITGEEANNIRLGSSLSEDRFEGEKFDYMITNPPYGVSWKSEKEFILNEKSNPSGRFSAGTPKTSDGSLLFLQHMISKMEPKGGRIGIVFNGSPLFSGDSGRGESEIRKWIIENDWLECIVSLPDQLFFNTGISTYVWLLTNKKSDKRKGKIQLINGSSFFKQMKKSLGDKRKEITEEQKSKLVNSYLDFKESEISKLCPNDFFGYTKVTIEQPQVDEDGNIITDKKGKTKADTKKRDYERIALLDDIDEYFAREVKPHLSQAWMDKTRAKVGYKINFAKYFHKYKPLRSVEEITQDLLKLDVEIEKTMQEIFL